jgi:hypothetical protein
MQLRGVFAAPIGPMVGLFAVVASSSCAAIHRPPTTVAALAATAPAGRAAEQQHRDSAVVRLARRVSLRGDRTVDLLFLSGGGQNGAYGAGFLRGWRQRNDVPMPQFDLVTGISTGALQAPFALIGTDAALDTLSALYRRAADRIAPKLDLLFWLRRTGGIVSTTRYRATMAQVFDGSMRSGLQHAFDADRQLFVGTTDLDLGVTRTWDLGAALQQVDGERRMQSILIASTAIPGIFPPVILDGHVHGDGGVISNLLPLLDIADYRGLAAQLADAGVGGTVTIRIWAIMNLLLSPRTVEIDPANRDMISRRAESLLFLGQQPQLVERMGELAAAVSSVPGLKVELHITAIPAIMAGDPGADRFFDRGWMQRLEQAGFDRAVGGAPWDIINP